MVLPKKVMRHGYIARIEFERNKLVTNGGKFVISGIFPIFSHFHSILSLPVIWKEQVILDIIYNHDKIQLCLAEIYAN